MNNTKALKILNKNLQVAVHDCDGLNPECEQDQQEQVKALQIAVKAVEKQIPKKPKYNLYMSKMPICPSCGHYIKNNTTIQKYCDFCGQAIKWESNTK